jgi:hypothetical protein
MIFKRAYAVLTGVLIGGGAMFAGVTAASAASQSGTCGAQGDYAICDASATFTKPVTLTVSVSASPSQQVSVNWTDTCSYGDGAGSNSGSFTATAPVTRTITHPYSRPASCVVAAGAQLSGSGSVTVKVSASASVPASHEVKGYDGKCMDDNGNSSALRAKVQIWTCYNDASQQWAYSHGELKHGNLCLNAQGGGSNGAHMILWTCNGAPNEVWTRTSSGEYVLGASGPCLDDPAYSTKNGTQLDVYACHNGANQRWTLP